MQPYLSTSTSVLRPAPFLNRPINRPSTLGPLTNKIGALGQWLLNYFSSSDNIVVVWDDKDMTKTGVHIYDRATGQRHQFTAESEARTWLERRYYQN